MGIVKLTWKSKEQKRKPLKSSAFFRQRIPLFTEISKVLICILLLFVVLHIEEIKMYPPLQYKDYNTHIKRALKSGLKSH